MILPSQPSKETTHLKTFFRHKQDYIAQSNRMTWVTEHQPHHPTPPPSDEVYKDNTNPDINFIDSDHIDNSDNNHNTSNSKNSERPRLVLRLKISMQQTAPRGTPHHKRGRRAAAAVTAGCGRDDRGGRGRGRGISGRKDKRAPPISAFDSSDCVMDQDDFDLNQDSFDSDSESSDSSSCSSYFPSTLSDTEQTAVMPLRRSTRVLKKTREYTESQEYEHEHWKLRGGGADGRRPDGSQRSGSEVEYVEYFVMPGEYDPDHPEGYYHYHQQQQQQQHKVDDDGRSGEERRKSESLDFERGSSEVTPSFWITPSHRSTSLVSPSPSRSALPSSAYFPCLEQEMSGGDEEREDGSGYAGDEDTNSAGEDNYKEKDDSVIAVMPSFSPLPSILNESSDNYSASSTQYFPPMLGMLNDSIGNCNAFTQYCPPPPMMPYNDYISNSTEENEDNTATVVDDDRPPSQTEITSITITSGNDDDDSEEDSSTERRSIADQMAIWGCVQYLGLEGRWDQVAVALGLESCPRVWELLESEYHRLRALKESGELSDREY